MASAWDLTALLNAADPKAGLAERHLWLIRLFEWLRHAPQADLPDAPAKTPTPLLRLKHLLGVLERHAEHRARVVALLGRFFADVDTTALLADFGFAPSLQFWGEAARRLRSRVLPQTPETTDLGELFTLLFPDAADTDWLDALDADTLARIETLVAPIFADGLRWRDAFLDAITVVAGAVRAAALAPALRPRLAVGAGGEEPFRPLLRAADALRAAVEAGDNRAALREAQLLRAALDACRRAADTVHGHLETNGVSVDVVFEVDQLRQRTLRIDALIGCVISPEPAPELRHLLAGLVRTAHAQRSLRAHFARHYSLLARLVAERSAETGEHYITRDRAAYRTMLRAAAGGGSVIALTTFVKFGLGALALSAFWGGFWAGVNYAASFVLVMLLHWTVATKQPAMTAPAMAAKLADTSDDQALEGFVDEVAHLIRSQSAGIIGNLALCAPVVLVAQAIATLATGAPLVDAKQGEYVLHSLTLLGPTAFFAAFTGVLLFASSLIAGWAENWFVWHRLDSAIAWHPRWVAILGPARAARWAAWWRRNVSGLAGNISLGLMLGIVPALLQFFGLAIEVRHVTLATGQLAAAAGAIGPEILRDPAFGWCVAGIAATGVLNLAVSFFLAFKVALRSRGIRLADRSRIHRAIRARFRRAPLSFVIPPKESAA